MLELMLRIETLLLELTMPVLLGAGGGVLLVGLLLWLSGDRYGSAIIGLLGAVVGSGVGMLVGQWLGYDLMVSMILGAAVLALVSALLKNVLVVILATLVVAGLSSGGYIALQMDEMMQDSPSASGVLGEQAQPLLMQSFNNMGFQERKAYLDGIAGDKEGFFEKLQALLADTWQRLSPHAVQVGLSALVGGIGALVLLWIVKRAIVVLAYSVVGSMSTVLGIQTLLLGLNLKAVSALNVDRWTLPIGFGVMVLIGCLSQLVLKRPKKGHIEREIVREIEESDPRESASDKEQLKKAFLKKRV
jgi:hypothetical protein